MTSYQPFVDFITTVDGAHVKVESMPSGAVSLEIRLGARVLVVDIASNGQIGISELGDEDQGFAGHDAAFTAVSAALSYLRARLVV